MTKAEATAIHEATSRALRGVNKATRPMQSDEEWKNSPLFAVNDELERIRAMASAELDQ